MHYLRLSLLIVLLLTITGCTEMRVEGDAKVFQTSSTGKIIGAAIGFGLMGLGAVACVGSVWPDRKPKNRYTRPNERLTTGQRVGLAFFGFSMGFMGLFLTGMSLLFPYKLHVTVYPDRVTMASTYSQAAGRAVTIPFSTLTKVEIRDEMNIVGKLKPTMVFTQKSGTLIKQDVGNNERQALATIQQALADYQKKNPAGAEPDGSSRPNPSATAALPNNPTYPSPSFPSSTNPTPRYTPPPTTPPAYTPPSTTPPASTTPPTFAPPAFTPPASPTQQENQKYRLKRYPIDIGLPLGYTLVGADTVVAAGTKLKACYARSWSPVTVVESNEDGTITCSWDDYPGFTYRMLREDLILANGSDSSQPTVEQPSPSAPSFGQQYTLKRYPINIAVPRGKSVLNADSKVKIGMKLGACYAGRWESVTVVEINDDGTITCNWDRWRSFTYRMMRDDLIMDTK
ncbi:MAG: hypothetical protein JNK90_25925 [Planctomycetaceae bacterium]|nr:hypothetical protein [Planctomycetaceae bacterium]